MLALQSQTFIGLNLQYGYGACFEHEFGASARLPAPGAFFGPSAERGANFRAFQAFIETHADQTVLLFFFTDYTLGADGLRFRGRAGISARESARRRPLGKTRRSIPARATS